MSRRPFPGRTLDSLERSIRASYRECYIGNGKWAQSRRRRLSVKEHTEPGADVTSSSRKCWDLGNMLLCLHSSFSTGVLLVWTWSSSVQSKSIWAAPVLCSLCEEIGFFLRPYRHQSALLFKGRVLSRSGVKGKILQIIPICHLIKDSFF